MSMEKVVEELKAEKDWALLQWDKTGNEYFHGKAAAFRAAISIVERHFEKKPQSSQWEILRDVMLEMVGDYLEEGRDIKKATFFMDIDTFRKAYPEVVITNPEVLDSYTFYLKFGEENVPIKVDDSVDGLTLVEMD